MAIKHADSVARYETTVAHLHAVLANLTEFVDSLPAPTETGTLEGMDYGHLGTLEHIKTLLGEASQAIDGFFK